MHYPSIYHKRYSCAFRSFIVHPPQHDQYISLKTALLAIYVKSTSMYKLSLDDARNTHLSNSDRLFRQNKSHVYQTSKNTIMGNNLKTNLTSNKLLKNPITKQCMVFASNPLLLARKSNSSATLIPKPVIV